MDDTPQANARTERHLQTLQELGELGMRLARAVTEEAVSRAAEPDGVGRDLGLVFSRISRAVRQTIALEAKLAEDRQKVQAEAGSRLAVETRLRGIRRKTKVIGIVERVIEAESDTERLLEALDERLDDADDGDFADRPIGDLVAAICRDLRVTPDWSLWKDEDWAMEAGLERARGEEADVEAGSPASAPGPNLIRDPPGGPDSGPS